MLPNLFSAALILAPGVALAAPHRMLARGETSNSTSFNTTAAYWVGRTDGAGPSSDACSFYYDVYNGFIQSGICYHFTDDGIDVGQLQDFDCQLAIYSGTTSCAEGEGVSVSTTQIPSGNGSVCFGTGVYDGGAHLQASGIWSCSKR